MPPPGGGDYSSEREERRDDNRWIGVGSPGNKSSGVNPSGAIVCQTYAKGAIAADCSR